MNTDTQNSYKTTADTQDDYKDKKTQTTKRLKTTKNIHKQLDKKTHNIQSLKTT